MKHFTLNQLLEQAKNDWEEAPASITECIESLQMSGSASNNYLKAESEEYLKFFLTNCSAWRGEIARRVKAELRKRLRNS
jgi:hypothetical protein